MRALIWIAVSTQEQASEDKASLAQQEADAIKFAEQNAWQIVDILRVPGHSRHYFTLAECIADADAVGVSAFRRLRDFIESRGFDVLIVRDGDRIARRASMYSEIIGKIIQAGARVYSFVDGWVDQHNYLMHCAMVGYRAEQDVANITRKYKMGIAKRIERGLNYNKVPASHRVIYDPTNGKPLRMELNPASQPLFDALYELVVEQRISFSMLPFPMAERGFINPATGLRFNKNVFYALLYAPPTWGHMAMGYRRERRKGKLGAWVFDESVPLPEGAIIFRNVIPAVYTGERAEAMRAELMRRADIRGRRRPRHHYPFSGLLQCVCGKNMAIQMRRWTNKRGISHHYKSYYCPFGRPSIGSRNIRFELCPNNAGIREERVREYFELLLQQIADGADFLPRVQSKDDTDDLRRTVITLERQIERLIDLQSGAPRETEAIYTKQIQQKAEQLKTARLELLKRQHAQATDQIRQQSFEQAAEDIIRIGLESFWQLGADEINQRLHRLMGKYRLVVENKQIIGIAIKGSTWR
ncbi:hypothetical protein FBQ95_17275 [Chloroflexi bacterium CFX3]|nr:hypothetical protein [Chloroflexi bacterium CFX3]